MKATEPKKVSRIPLRGEARTMATAKRSSGSATQVPGSHDATAHLGRYARLVRSLGCTRAGAWLGVYLWAPLDRRLFSLTGGAFKAWATVDLPILILTTLGRRTHSEGREEPIVEVAVVSRNDSDRDGAHYDRRSRLRLQ